MCTLSYGVNGKDKSQHHLPGSQEVGEGKYEPDYDVTLAGKLCVLVPSC